MPDLPLMEGYAFFGSIGAVLIGISLAEKIGVKVDGKAVEWALMITFWVGMGIMLVVKNPLWKWL